MVDPVAIVSAIASAVSGLETLTKLAKSQSPAKSDERIETINREVMHRFTAAYEVLIDAIGELWQIRLEENSDIVEAKKLLFKFKIGWFRPDIMVLRHYSYMITKIYEDYLTNKWHRKKKNKSVSRFFLTNLRNLCDNLSQSFEHLEGDLSHFSGEILDLLQENKLSEAKLKLKEFTTLSIKPVEKIRKGLETLSALQKQFIIAIDDGFEVVDFHKMRKDEKYSFNFEGSQYEFRKDDKGNLLVTEVG